jgi:hypothetical protein
MWAGNSEGDAINWDPSAPGKCAYTTGESNFQCMSSYVPGTKVKLTAEPHEGAMFLGWFGGCSGTGVCQITMDRDKTVTASFQMTPTPTPDYNAYCRSKYPGSVYNSMTNTCQYQTVQTMTPSSPISPGGTNRPTLIPIDGGCCPNEPCDTQIADATGGTPPYHYSSGSFANGAPPMGMIINLNGHLTGTASAVGIYSFNICVADITGATDCKQTRLIVS